MGGDGFQQASNGGNQSIVIPIYETYAPLQLPTCQDIPMCNCGIYLFIEINSCIIDLCPTQYEGKLPGSGNVGKCKVQESTQVGEQRGLWITGR